MTDDKIILANFLDKAKLCAAKNIATATKFLTPAQQTLCADLARGEKLNNYGFYGVADDAERKIAVFYPDYTDFDGAKGDFIALLRCTKSPQDTLTHRDYLGSLLGLGLERPVIGDIFVHDTGADVAVLREILPFLLTSYEKAGRKTLSVAEIAPEHLHMSQSQGEEVRQTLSSLRLDCVVSGLWKLSRSAAEAVIAGGQVLINGLECKKCDKLLKEGDKINLKGKGKCIFVSQVGMSKKGKLVGVFEKFI